MTYRKIHIGKTYSSCEYRKFSYNVYGCRSDSKNSQILLINNLIFSYWFQSRYSMFKVGPVLSISHGMGVPSLSILMHEVVKLLWHAGVYDATFFRIGTCGGIGLDPGSVVVSTNVLDGRLQPYHETVN